eukprot:m.288903 g.288903  ORF g.288903 m.288903 type:complete len:54 (+) comp19455_c1_seq2:53-214(+)
MFSETQVYFMALLQLEAGARLCWFFGLFTPFLSSQSLASQVLLVLELLKHLGG